MKCITIIHCYLCRDSCVKCSLVVECALIVCVLCQPVHPSSHSYIYIHLENFFLYGGCRVCAARRLPQNPKAKVQVPAATGIGVWGYEILGVLIVIWAKILLCNYSIMHPLWNSIYTTIKFFCTNVVELTGILFTRDLWIISGSRTKHDVIVWPFECDLKLHVRITVYNYDWWVIDARQL